MVPLDTDFLQLDRCLAGLQANPEPLGLFQLERLRGGRFIPDSLSPEGIGARPRGMDDKPAGRVGEVSSGFLPGFVQKED